MKTSETSSHYYCFQYNQLKLLFVNYLLIQLDLMLRR